MGTIARTICSVEGPAFGPLYSGLQHKTWSLTVITGLTETIRDLEEHAGLDASDLHTVREIARANATYLDEIERPQLCHGDLWTVNILVKRTAEAPVISAVLEHPGAIPWPTGPSSCSNCISPLAPQPSGKHTANQNTLRAGVFAT